MADKLPFGDVKNIQIPLMCCRERQRPSASTSAVRHPRASIARKKKVRFKDMKLYKRFFQEPSNALKVFVRRRKKAKGQEKKRLNISSSRRYLSCEINLSFFFFGRQNGVYKVTTRLGVVQRKQN